MTSDDLQSEKVFINGKLAQFPPDVLKYGIKEENTFPFVIRKYSYVFMLFEESNDVTIF